MLLHIDPHLELPVYRQIERQIADAIAHRSLRPGDPLQPAGDLAARLVVSPGSVRRAYERLVASGLCRKEPSGTSYHVVGPGLPRAAEVGQELVVSPTDSHPLAREIQLARDAQSRLLPPAESEGRGWRFTARSLAAGSLAGDFYDLIDEPDGGVGVAVGDVAGKGLAAGLIMAIAKSTLPLIAAGQTVEVSLRELNERLRATLARRSFVALAYARLDPRHGSLELANAGLPDPYLIRADGSVEVLSVPEPRLPLGLKQAVPYSALRQTMRPGDRLVLITDGIAEARDQSGDPIGYDRLAQLVRRVALAETPCSARPPDSLPARLFEVAAGLAGTQLDDDWTAVQLERRAARE